jgi:hypothetical protein
MSYGISITNNSNETVVDDTNTLILVDSEFTGSPVASFSGWYRYDVPANVLPMFKVNVGVSLVRISNSYNQFWATTSSIDIAYCKFAKDITLSTGYGMRVFDASGNVVYDASEKLLPFKGLYYKTTNSSGGGWSQSTQGGNYFTITSNNIANFYGPEPAGVIVHCGFTRSGTSSLSGIGFNDTFGVGPVNLNGNVQILEAG